jgi:hypothetical protein
MTSTTTGTLFSPVGSGGTMIGATGSTTGAGGTVPTPSASSQDLVLHGDGNWRTAIPNWSGLVDYSPAALVFQNHRIWRCHTVHTSNLSFDAAEQANWLPMADIGGNPTTFISDTAMAPAAAGAPTLAEATAAITAAGLTDAIAYYNATNTAATTPTYVWHVDGVGAVTLIERPATAGAGTPAYTASFTTGSWVAGTGIHTLTYPASTHNQGNKPFVTVAETVGADFNTVAVQTLVTATGTVVLTVPTGDTFNGRIMISAGLGGTVTGSSGNPTTFAGVTAVAPAGSNPTDAEIATFASTTAPGAPLTNRVVYYNGTDNPIGTTYTAWHVDSVGAVIALARNGFYGGGPGPVAQPNSYPIRVNETSNGFVVERWPDVNLGVDSPTIGPLAASAAAYHFSSAGTQATAQFVNPSLYSPGHEFTVHVLNDHATLTRTVTFNTQYVMPDGTAPGPVFLAPLSHHILRFVMVSATQYRLVSSTAAPAVAAATSPYRGDWSATATYAVGDVVWKNIFNEINGLFRCATANGPLATINYSQWNLLSQDIVTPTTGWIAGTALPAGYRFMNNTGAIGNAYNGVMFRLSAARTTGASFDATERGFWVEEWSSGTTAAVSTITASTSYGSASLPTNQDEYVMVDTTAGDVTVTLSVTGPIPIGRKFSFHKLVAANNMIVASGFNSQVLSNLTLGSTETFAAQFTDITYIWTGSRWNIHG